MEDAILRRTWAEIDLDALEHNYKVARTRIGDGVKYLGVVKADAYGHGAIQVSRKLEQLGADYLAVASLDEARELRHAGITLPILIVGHTPPEMVPQLISSHIRHLIYTRVHRRKAAGLSLGSMDAITEASHEAIYQSIINGDAEAARNAREQILGIVPAHGLDYFEDYVDPKDIHL